MACPASRPVRPLTPAYGDIRPRLPPSPQADAGESSSPNCSFREAIITAAERLAQPVAKRRKVTSGQSRTGLHKINQQKALNDSSEKTVYANSTQGKKLETYTPCKVEESLQQPAKQVLPTALSKSSLDRLDVFRFQLPQKAATQTTSCERNTLQNALLIDDQPSNDTVPPHKNSHENHRSLRSNRLMNSAASLETTLSLEHELFGHSGMARKTHLVDCTHTNPSSSLFEADDFDQSSLEDAFQTAEDDMNQHFREDTNQEDLIPCPAVQLKLSPADSDFGSDPFELDDAGSQNELHQQSSCPFSSFDSRMCQADEHNFSKSRENLETTLPPSYQTPRKSPPTTKAPINLQTHQSATPSSPHTRTESSSQGQHSAPTPFLRANLPKPVPPNSPISNIIPAKRILTCFRTAEYLRAIAPATTNTYPPSNNNNNNNNNHLLIELYATVTSSTRTRTNSTQTQHFTFSDLFFPHHPPHLQGAWHSTWQGSDLYEDDTRPFLSASAEKGKGKMCRAIVRPKKGPVGGSLKQVKAVGSPSPMAAGRLPEAWSVGLGLGRERDGDDDGDGDDVLSGQVLAEAEMEVLSIWQADWEDVQYVRGIVQSA